MSNGPERIGVGAVPHRHLVEQGANCDADASDLRACFGAAGAQKIRLAACPAENARS
jgi:hypothetical protein